MRGDWGRWVSDQINEWPMWALVAFLAVDLFAIVTWLSFLVRVLTR